MVITPLISSAGRYGDISYGLYLYGFPVQQLVAWRLHGTLPVPVQIVIALIGAGACAFVSWRLIEEPALRLKPRGKRSARENYQPETQYGPMQSLGGS